MDIAVMLQHMTFADIIQGITALGAIFAGIVSLVNRNAIKEVHLTMNSRLDQLLRASMEQARGEGHAAGVAESMIDPAVTAEAAAKVLAVAEANARPIKKE